MKLQFTASQQTPGNTPDGTLSHLANTKINRVRCLTNRATRICSPRRLDEELDCIRNIFANNVYPPHVNRTIRNALNPRARTTDSDSDVQFIYYAGQKKKKTATTIMHKIKTLFLSRNISMIRRLAQWHDWPRLRASLHTEAQSSLIFDIP